MHILVVEEGGEDDPNAIWIADAHRGDGKRFVVRADERLTAFMELECAIQRLKAECGRRKRVGPCLTD
jgi:hypothetical protein